MSVACAYHTNKDSYLYDLNRTQDKRVIYITLWCHGNLVTIAMRYVADAYYPKQAPCQIGPQ